MVLFRHSAAAPTQLSATGRQLSYRGVVCASMLFGWAANCSLAAQPYIPASDDEVVEQLPRSLIAAKSELTPLRRALVADPNNAELACTLAARYLQLGSAEGDPRFFGYARAAIQPWWDADSPPSSVLKLRAKLKEKEHQYGQAVADLKLLLQAEPRDVQAWIELANIYQVQGEYDQARAACESLIAVAGELATSLCRAPIMAATGEAEEAYDLLAGALPQAQARAPGAVQWILTKQAEIALALGRDRQAERHFKEGLANDAQDYYLMRAYADFLLDRDREDEVIALLSEHTADNGILLRAAIAARRSGRQTQADRWQAQLASRFEEIRLRGSEPHGRYEARFALELEGDPEHALSLAAANWQRQKEVRDTRNLLEAAVAARDPAAAQPALDFLSAHGTQNVVLQELARRLELKR